MEKLGLTSALALGLTVTGQRGRRGRRGRFFEEAVRSFSLASSSQLKGLVGRGQIASVDDSGQLRSLDHDDDAEDLEWD
jgi:hypothetical protein